MNAEPLSREIYNRCKADGVKKITLAFSGGNDEGYLDVSCEPSNGMEDEIEEWAWTVYDYSGAGDGSDYGDNIVYDLERNSTTSQEWSHVPQYGKEDRESLEISDE